MHFYVVVSFAVTVTRLCQEHLTEVNWAIKAFELHTVEITPGAVLRYFLQSDLHSLTRNES